MKKKKKHGHKPVSVYSLDLRERERETLKARKFEEQVCSLQTAFVLTVCVTKSFEYCVNGLCSVNNSSL